MDFVAQLAALMPPRGQHTVRYHGVLASASPMRRRVILRPKAASGAAAEVEPLGDACPIRP